MLGVVAGRGKELKFKKGERGVALPTKTTTPLRIFERWQSDHTVFLPFVARSVMNNFYGVISATETKRTSQAFCS